MLGLPFLVSGDGCSPRLDEPTAGASEEADPRAALTARARAATAGPARWPWLLHHHDALAAACRAVLRSSWQVKNFGNFYTTN